jgi:hypothetical protein
MSPSRSLLADQLRLARAVPHERGTVAKGSWMPPHGPTT